MEGGGGQCGLDRLQALEARLVVDLVLLRRNPPADRTSI